MKLHLMRCAWPSFCDGLPTETLGMLTYCKDHGKQALKNRQELATRHGIRALAAVSKTHEAWLRENRRLWEVSGPQKPSNLTRDIAIIHEWAKANSKLKDP